MGYGLSINVPVFVNHDRRFDLVIDHYRAFDLETGPAGGMDLEVYPPTQSRFSTFLELVQNLDSTGCESALVVNHGMSDANDNPIGLWLPLTAHAPQWNVAEYPLDLLSNYIGFIPDDDECKAAEKKSLMNGAPMPAGTIKPLATALQNLRKKNRLKRLELRACNLGGNDKIMELLGMVLGVRTVVAPKVHMFYMRVSIPGPLPLSAAGFTTWQNNHRQSRTFTGAAAANPQVGIQVYGTHSFRTMDFATTGLDVTWFIEKYICPGSGYSPQPPGRHARVAPFTFSAMDVNGSFALAQESAYEAQLVEQAIPRVALEVTVETK